jgi:hypothetical protein
MRAAMAELRAMYFAEICEFVMPLDPTRRKKRVPGDKRCEIGPNGKIATQKLWRWKKLAYSEKKYAWPDKSK